jgi:hypothetical protein
LKDAQSQGNPDMVVKLPSKDMILEACSGNVPFEHLVLAASYKLAVLHEERRGADPGRAAEIDLARAEAVHDIDQWVSAQSPRPAGAAYLHTESVGMVIDRIGQYFVDAHDGLNTGVPEPRRHFLWQRLAELAVAYGDLAFEITAGIRGVPKCTYPASPLGSTAEHDMPCDGN